jgi:hypothetical protein
VFVAVEEGHWVGMLGGYLEVGNPRAAGLWGMWVALAARRRGLGTSSSKRRSGGLEMSAP